MVNISRNLKFKLKISKQFTTRAADIDNPARTTISTRGNYKKQHNKTCHL